MAKRGGFSHNYDAAAMYRFKANQDAMTDVSDAISAQVIETVEATIDALAADIAAQHGIHPDVARLFITQRACDGLDYLRTVKAGEARGAGVPVRGLMDAMGYSSPTSISRMTGTLDEIAATRAQVDATGQTTTLTSELGYTVTLSPRDDAAATVEQARKRGLLPAEDPADQ